MTTVHIFVQRPYGTSKGIVTIKKDDDVKKVEEKRTEEHTKTKTKAMSDEIVRPAPIKECPFDKHYGRGIGYRIYDTEIPESLEEIERELDMMAKKAEIDLKVSKIKSMEDALDAIGYLNQNNFIEDDSIVMQNPRSIVEQIDETFANEDKNESLDI